MRNQRLLYFVLTVAVLALAAHIALYYRFRWNPLNFYIGLGFGIAFILTVAGLLLTSRRG